MLVKGFRLNKKQHDKLYEEMAEIYNEEVCACCLSTKKEKGVKRWKIHHTRYDVDPLDPKFTRFFCNSCQQHPDLTVEKIWEYNKKNPLPDLPIEDHSATPRTFQKGEVIDKRLREYLPRRLMELSEKENTPSPKILYEDFRADASNYCKCLPKAVDQHMIALCSKEEGLYKFYESPNDQKQYVTWRE